MLKIRQPPRSTHFPYTTPFRSGVQVLRESRVAEVDPDRQVVTVASPAGRTVLEDVAFAHAVPHRSEEQTSELQSRQYLVCRLLLEKKKRCLYALLMGCHCHQIG